MEKFDLLSINENTNISLLFGKTQLDSHRTSISLLYSGFFDELPAYSSGYCRVFLCLLEYPCKF